jgi:hypothetical protein
VPVSTAISSTDPGRCGSLSRRSPGASVHDHSSIARVADEQPRGAAGGGGPEGHRVLSRHDGDRLASRVRCQQLGERDVECGGELEQRREARVGVGLLDPDEQAGG